MSSIVPIDVAQVTLATLVAARAPGETVFLTVNDRVVAKLIIAPAYDDRPIELGGEPKAGGWTAPDFDEPMMLIYESECTCRLNREQHL